MSNNKPGLAVQFGAGNIGRGFVGELLWQAGYEVVFVDVIDSIIDLFNERGQYTIKTLGAGETQRQVVSGVSAINGKDQAAVADAVSRAAIVTTAVGPNVLRIIAPTIAAGLAQRAENGVDAPLNIIACENLIDNSKILRDHVQEHLSLEGKVYADEFVGFPCCVVDKVVTDPTEADKAEDPLIAVAEGGGKLIVDEAAFVGPLPAIDGMQFTDKLAAYVEQKIFTLNTAHAISAYLGYQKGYEFVHEAIADPEIRAQVGQALAEVSAVLEKRHHIDPADQKQYAAAILQRFENDTMPDPVVRVGREPARKLSPNDRLVRPALLALEQGITPTGLAAGIAAALAYNHPDDPQAAALQETLRSGGVEAALQETSNLEPGHPLIALVKEQLAAL